MWRQSNLGYWIGGSGTGLSNKSRPKIYNHILFGVSFQNIPLTPFKGGIPPFFAPLKLRESEEGRSAVPAGRQGGCFLDHSPN